MNETRDMRDIAKYRLRLMTDRGSVVFFVMRAR